MIGDVYEVNVTATAVFRITSKDADEEAAVADGTGAKSVREGFRDLLADELEAVGGLVLKVTAAITPSSAPPPHVGRHRQLALFDI